MASLYEYLAVKYMKAWGTGSLASAALLGWVLALDRSSPTTLRKIGIPHSRQILRLHLDQVMMGTILLATATAFPDLPPAIAIPLTFGCLMNPLGFVPLMFSSTADKTLAYRAAIGISFISTSTGFVGLAWWAYQHI